MGQSNCPKSTCLEDAVGQTAAGLELGPGAKKGPAGRKGTLRLLPLLLKETGQTKHHDRGNDSLSFLPIVHSALSVVHPIWLKTSVPNPRATTSCQLPPPPSVSSQGPTISTSASYRASFESAAPSGHTEQGRLTPPRPSKAMAVGGGASFRRLGRGQ